MGKALQLEIQGVYNSRDTLTLMIFELFYTVRSFTLWSREDLWSSDDLNKLRMFLVFQDTPTGSNVCVYLDISNKGLLVAMC